jgi:hypothetical protein
MGVELPRYRHDPTRARRDAPVSPPPDLSSGSHRGRVAGAQAAAAARQGWRSTPPIAATGGAPWPPRPPAGRLCRARDAARSAPGADRRAERSRLAPGWHRAQESRAAPRRGPDAHGTPPAAVGRQHRCASGDHHRQRGARGDDGATPRTGRTRQRRGETPGRLGRVRGHPAARREADPAPGLLATADAACARLRHLGAARADRGQPLRAWGEAAGRGTLESVERPRRWGWSPIAVAPPPRPACTGLPRRWAVARTSAWSGRYRRVSHAYADLPARRAALSYWARSRLMRRRWARQAPYGVPRPQRHGLRGLARAV